jgi:hypothetical protein
MSEDYRVEFGLMEFGVKPQSSEFIHDPMCSFANI